MKKRNGQLTITLLLSALIFCLLFLTVLLAAGVLYVLMRSGLVALPGSSPHVYYLILYMGLISLVIGGVLVALTGRFALRPIRQVVERMQLLAAGDFSTRLHISRRAARLPALIELEESFNRLAQELENTEMLRSDFINNFSHEFKTPIVSIAGFAKLLKRGRLTEAQREEYLNIIEEESLRLSYMATNVLNLTKVENQKILTGVTEFNLSEQLRACILLLERKWARKNLELRLDFPECRIMASEELLKEVWINLFDNAIKFSPANGTVAVALTETEQTLAVRVSNGGESILPEHQERIFHKFYQADESHAAEGNGIGLAIVRRVVELHHGSVRVHSRDGCTSFTVELPKTQKGERL